MIARFEELDWQETRMGELNLRRRTDSQSGELIYEVKLGDEYLMSSLFTVAEEELARLGLAATDGGSLAVLVGGLGLGYTAVTALEDNRVARLDVIDALPAVIGWHERHLLPVSTKLVDDPRTTLVLRRTRQTQRCEQHNTHVSQQPCWKRYKACGRTHMRRGF